MDQDRYETRRIDEARERVSDDVRSVAYNANVVDRAKEAAQDRMDTAREAMGNAGMRMKSMTVDNPMSMLLAGLACGFLIGMLLPVTRFEAERIGPMTDQMKDRVREAGSEAMRRGGEVIKDTIEAGKEAAMSSVRNQTADMRPSDTSSMT